MKYVKLDTSYQTVTAVQDDTMQAFKLLLTTFPQFLLEENRSVA